MQKIKLNLNSLYILVNFLIFGPLGTLPRDDLPGFSFYFRLFQKIIFLFKRTMYWHLICIYPVTFNYLFKLWRNHGYLWQDFKKFGFHISRTIWNYGKIEWGVFTFLVPKFRKMLPWSVGLAKDTAFRFSRTRLNDSHWLLE